MHSCVLRLCGRYHTLNPCLAGHAVRIFLLGMERFMYRYLKRFGMCHPSHTHPFNGPLSGTTRVSRYQKGKTNLDFTEARDSEWQWQGGIYGNSFIYLFYLFNTFTVAQNTQSASQTTVL